MAHHHGSSSSSSSSDSSTMTGMSSAFFSSQNTPLYSNSWTPHTPAQYALTCIFLIAFAALFRALIAAKHILEMRWLDQHLNRRYIVVAGQDSEAKKVAGKGDTAESAMLVSANGKEEGVRVVKRPNREAMPWRWSVDLPRALMVTALATVGYFLMLAIMTYNVGYFLSVLGGIFLGELLVGRYVTVGEHVH